MSGAGDDADEVKGMTTFYTDGCGHIYAVYAEFDSAAWLYNLGYSECSSSVVTFASTLTSTLPATPAAATSVPALTTVSDPGTTTAATTTSA